MSKNQAELSVWEVLKSRLNSLLIVTISIFADSFFMALWLLLNCGVSYLKEKYEPEDAFLIFVTTIFEYSFALASLVPVVIFIITDTIRVFRYAVNELKNEKP